MRSNNFWKMTFVIITENFDFYTFKNCSFESIDCRGRYTTLDTLLNHTNIKLFITLERPLLFVPLFFPSLVLAQSILYNLQTYFFVTLFGFKGLEHIWSRTKEKNHSDNCFLYVFSLLCIEWDFKVRSHKNCQFLAEYDC